MPPVVDLAHAAIVVAHPDDEILWFSSLVTKVGRIVMCYGAISPTSERAANRRRLVEVYPLDTVTFLDLPIPAAVSTDADECHRRVLIDRLSTALKGVTTIFTHNPWGEYGQADHRRVYAAVNTLRRDMNFVLYVSCYVARHQLAELAIALKEGIAEIVSFAIPQLEVDRIVAFYRSNSCWTWAPNWMWPRREHFLRLCKGGRTAEIRVHLFGSRVKSRAEMRQPWRRLFKAKTSERVFANPSRTLVP